MGMMFGGSPVATPSIDAILGKPGLGGAPLPGNPDPAAVIASLGIKPAATMTSPPATMSASAPGVDLASMVGAQPSASAAPSPPPAQPPAADAAALPPNLLYGDRNPVGDLLDNVFFGGGIQHYRDVQRQRASADFQTKLAMQQYVALNNYINALPDGEEKTAALANPLEYGKTLMARHAPDDLKEGETRYLGNGQVFNAPHYGFDEKSGTPYAQAGTNTTFSPALGGDYSVTPNGQVVSGRSGPTGQTLPTFQKVGAGETGSFVAPPGSGAAGGSADATGGVPGLAPIMAATVRLESGGNPNAQNGQSTGLLQFHPATFARFAPQGSNINDPAAQQAAFANETAHNSQQLTAAGLPVTPANIYLLHQQGTAGGLALLQNPGKNAVQTLTDAGFYPNARVARRAITRNYGTVDMTGAQFAGVWAGKMARAMRRTGGAAAATARASGGGGLPSSLQGKTYTMNADGSQTSPTGEVSAGPTMLKPTDAVAMGKSILDDPSYRAAKESGAAFNAMLSLAAQPPGGMRAYALRDTFARTINPGAVARAGTIEAIKSSQGIPANVQAYLMNMKGDGDVPPQIVKQILAAAVPFAQAHYDEANALNQHFAGIAKSHNLDPTLATAPLGARPALPRQGGGDILAEARAAIAKGAPRAAVIARLQHMGVNPAGL